MTVQSKMYVYITTHIQTTYAIISQLDMKDKFINIFFQFGPFKIIIKVFGTIY